MTAELMLSEGINEGNLLLPAVTARQQTLQVLYLLRVEQLVQRKINGLIVYPTGSDSPRAALGSSWSYCLAVWGRERERAQPLQELHPGLCALIATCDLWLCLSERLLAFGFQRCSAKLWQNVTFSYFFTASGVSCLSNLWHVGLEPINV